MVTLLHLLLGTYTFATAAIIPESYTLHERRNTEKDQGWVKKARIPGDAPIPVRIGLQQNSTALKNAHDWLMDVSHPSSKNYGQHWTQDEVIRAFQPAETTVNEVLQWLTVNGSIPRQRIVHTDNKAWLAFHAPAEKMEDLLKTEFFEYQSKHSAALMISCDEYYIPANLVDHIDYITPGTKGTIIKGPRAQKSDRTSRQRRRESHSITARGAGTQNGTSLANCDKLITPACLQALYQFKPLDANTTVSPNNSMGIFEVSSTYRQRNLNSFYEAYVSYIPQGWKPVFKGIDGGLTPNETKSYKQDDDNPEADLDFQVAIPIVWPQTTTDFQTDDPEAGYYEGIMNTFFDGIDGSYCNYTAYGETGDAPGIDPTYPDTRKGPFTYNGTLQCGTWKPTNVVTTSYLVYEQDLPYYYQKRQCNEVLKLGLQGVSVFAASGDTGVTGDDYNTKTGCLGKTGKVFDITNLRGCPYTTVVGATKIPPGSTVNDPEVAAANASNTFWSSGGFSNIFTVPSYQNSTIATYFSEHNPAYPYYYNGTYNQSATGVYNRNGRGIPDVSANGQSIATFYKGKPFVQSGTSASSPIFAAIVTRINEERIKAGKGPVGFINPVLYEHPEVLNDITQGNNPGCNTTGFSAVKGWDPVTGLGTPNYPKMLKLFLSLP